MPLDKIKKRDGRIVEFNRLKIENAILKASIGSGVTATNEQISDVTDKVLAQVDERFVEITPDVETIQDIVEKTLAENGLFEVAKAYIIYRKDREEARIKEQQENLEKVEHNALSIKTKDGQIQKFDINKIKESVARLVEDFPEITDTQDIVEDVKRGIFEGMTTAEISELITMALRARAELDPAYSYAAARNLFDSLYKQVLKTGKSDSNFEAVYRNTFKDMVRKGVEHGRYDKRLLDFDFERISSAIRPERDEIFMYMGAATLHERYFVKDKSQQYLEAPQYFWMRVAMGLALTEEKKEDWAIEFYNTVSQTRYVPSTPTLFHSGTTHPQMSSCYITTVEDDLHHIFKCIGDNAQLAKWSGGIGNDWTSIRATGARIKSTNVGSQGVIPFLKIADATTASINRSGKRRGATCIYLETWHYDIEHFLDLRKNTGDDRRRTHDTNTANWIPDLFIKRVMADGNWTLFSPDECPELHHIYGKEFEEKYTEYERMAEEGKIHLFKTIKAKDLWRKMLTMLFETGHPWITFKDPCNLRSPQDHVGTVHSSNLCTEITLNTSKDETAVCNLGSVNLSLHVHDGKLDKVMLERTVKTAMRMLDNVIDLNFYPTKEAEVSNLRHRPVGLGVMGLQDALYKLDLNFDSDAAAEFSDETQEFISYHAILGSSELAKEKGAYSSYKGSKWDRGLFPIDTLDLWEEHRAVPIPTPRTSRLDWTPVREHVKLYGMRNSNTMAIAPTATISNISGVSPTIEPIYKNLYVKSNVSGEFTVVNKALVDDLKKLGLWGREMVEALKHSDGSIQMIPNIPAQLKEKYKEAFEIDPIWTIKHAARRAKWLDQSQSVNIFSATTSGKKLSEIYLEAWTQGLKTTYYLRSLGASSIEKASVQLQKKAEPQPAAAQPVAAPVEQPVVKESVTQPAAAPNPTATGAPAASEPDMDSAAVAKASAKMACSILDPDCESCQ